MTAPYMKRLTNSCTGYSGPNRALGLERAVTVSTVDDNRIAIALYAREKGVEQEDMGLVVTRDGARELADAIAHAVEVVDSEE